MYYDKTLGAPASSGKRMSAWGIEKPVTAAAQSKVSPAEAARLNVASRGLDEEVIVEATLSLLAGGNDKKFKRLAREIRTAGKTRAEMLGSAHTFQTDLSAMPAAHLQHVYLLPPLSYPGPSSPEGYAARLLSRHANPPIVSALERELSVSHERHGESLREVRSYSPEIYGHLVRGFPRAALETAAQSGDDAVSFVRPVVAIHVMLLAIATANLRIAELANPAKNPLVKGWAGQARWPTMRQVSLAALVEPACALHQLLGLSVDEEMADARALEIARSSGLLADDSSSQFVVSIADQVRNRLPEHNLTRSHVEHTVRFALRSSDPLKSLTIEDLNEAGWTRRTFTEEQFGVTATEGAVIVSINLAVQRERIRACIDAVLDGHPLPSFDIKPSSGNLSNNSLARITEALRIEGRADKSAPEEPGDPENHNGKQLVMRTRKKIDKGEVDNALTRLRIDPAVFFHRRINTASIGYSN